MKLKSLVAGVAAVIVAAGLGGVSADALAPNPSGDAALINRTRTTLDNSQFNNVSVAYIDGNNDTIKYANFGAGNTTEYEIASLSKLFTGQLYGDALNRGAVKSTTNLSGTGLGINPWSASSTVTLGQLAVNRGGYARWPAPVMFDQQVNGPTQNPIPYSRSNLVTHASQYYFLPNRGVYQYTNIGSALLGHGVAAKSGTTYKSLLQSRILNPMNLSQTRYLSTASEVTPSTTRGSFDNNVTVNPTWGDGYAPAMGFRSTIGDMASFTRQVIKGTAPGMNALTPSSDTNVPGLKIGYQWFIDQNTGYKGKSGATAGFTSHLIINPANKTGVVVLANVGDGGNSVAPRADQVSALAYGIIQNNGQ